MAEETSTVNKIASRYVRRLNLHDPEYNIRETAKQMILLEEHLFQPHKLCPDCVRKHLMTIEALGEEVVSLTQPDIPFHGIYRQVGPLISKLARQWLEEFHDGRPPAELAAEIRELRKAAVECCPDPRRDEEDYDEVGAAVNRVASLYVIKENLK